jgi:putative transposase
MPLIVIDHGNRRVHLAGITANPGRHGQQAARNFLMNLGHRGSSQVPDQDRAGQFTSSFDAVLTAEGIRIRASPPQGAKSERDLRKDHRYLRREFFDRLLIVDEHHLPRADSVPAAQHRPAASCPWPGRTGSNSRPDHRRSTSPSTGSAKQVLGGLIPRTPDRHLATPRSQGRSRSPR